MSIVLATVLVVCLRIFMFLCLSENEIVYNNYHIATIIWDLFCYLLATFYDSSSFGYLGVHELKF